MWFSFWDMHSGGDQKLDYSILFIEADNRDDAETIFYNKFNRDPNNVTCYCCGNDYSVSNYETLDEATSYHRGENTPYRKQLTIEEFSENKNILILRKEDISEEDQKYKGPRIYN